jgi:hypothetical protein
VSCSRKKYAGATDHASQTRSARLAILGPLVLAADLILLLWGEVILDVEGLSDLLWGFALDHVGHGLAADVQEGFDIQVVGSLDDQLVASLMTRSEVR